MARLLHNTEVFPCWHDFSLF